MLAIALVLEGSDRKGAAETCGMDRQTLRDWVHRYNAEGLAGLTNRPSPGRRPRLGSGAPAIRAHERRRISCPGSCPWSCPGLLPGASVAPPGGGPHIGPARGTGERRLGIGDWADDLLDGLDRARRGWDEMFEPVVRLGVTGLSGAGKTVFITALVASLLHRGRMRLLKAEAEGRILAAMLQPQPDPELPRFAYEEHLAALTGREPHWPELTRQISQLRLSMKVQPGGVFSFISGVRTLHLDIVDYPGEWLLDLPLLDKSYADWSAEALAAAESPARAELARVYTERLPEVDAGARARRARRGGAGRALSRLSGACAGGGPLVFRAGAVPDAWRPGRLAGADLFAAAAAGAGCTGRALERVRAALRGL